MQRTFYRFVVILFSAALLAGCELKTEVKSSFTPPVDESTPQERAMIDQALTQISDVTENFGPRREFRSIQIIVTSEDPKAHDRSAYCMTGVGAPLIAINRYLFADHIRPMALVTSLLHEIGHCYFGRGHEEEKFRRMGFSFAFVDSSDPMHTRMNLYSNICVTIMCGRSLAPVALLKYYVGELLGQPRAKTIDDLERYSAWIYVPSP